MVNVFLLRCLNQVLLHRTSGLVEGPPRICGKLVFKRLYESLSLAFMLLLLALSHLKLPIKKGGAPCSGQTSARDLNVRPTQHSASRRPATYTTIQICVKACSNANALRTWDVRLSFRMTDATLALGNYRHDGHPFGVVPPEKQSVYIYGLKKAPVIRKRSSSSAQKRSQHLRTFAVYRAIRPRLFCN